MSKEIVCGAARWWLPALVWLVVWLAAPAAARTVLELDTARQPVAMGDWGDAWIDASGARTADQVAGDASIVWKETQPHGIYPTDSGNALWVRFSIPPAPDTERWYLEVPYPAVNRVTVYARDNLGMWLPQSAGDTIAVASWPVPHRYPLMPVRVSAEEPQAYLLRIENPHSFGAPFSFVSESYVSHHEQRVSLILGIYFGLAGLAVTLALLSAVSLRDNTYAYYAVAVALMGLTQASQTGVAGLQLWPRWPLWNDAAATVLPMLTVAAILAFFSSAVALASRSKALHNSLMALVAVAVAASLALLWLPLSQRHVLGTGYILVAVTMGFISLTWAARRGDRYAFWLILAMLPAGIAALFPMARIWGLMPINFLSQHAMQIGIAIELPLLLVILMLRSQHRREHNRRMQGLDRNDPATGLVNGYVFAERLERLIARSQRLKHQGAVLVIDIVNIEQLRKDFDRRSADEMPLRVAGRLLTAAREIDSVARLSELRFGMLVEGPLSEAEAAAAGPRVVARCLMPFKKKPPDWVPQVRVAQAVVPRGDLSAAVVIAQLEATLDAAPAETRRAVFNLRPAAA